MSFLQPFYRSRVVVLGWALCLLGCPGSLEDREAFLAFVEAGAHDAGNPIDSGSGASQDTGSPPIVDTGTAPVPDGPIDCTNIMIPPHDLPIACAFPGCHSAKDNAGNLDLESANLFARLLDKPSAAGFLIDSKQPTQSTLYTKLLDPPPYGKQMPQGLGAFDAPTTGCVLSWIEEQLTTADQ